MPYESGVLRLKINSASRMIHGSNCLSGSGKLQDVLLYLQLWLQF
jgi:hypothetical protein